MRLVAGSRGRTMGRYFEPASDMRAADGQTACAMASLPPAYESSPIGVEVCRSVVERRRAVARQ